MEHTSIAELMSLKGKVAVVTGGAVGIGYAIAARLAEAGASVLIADRDALKASAAVALLVEQGHNVSLIVTDVSDEVQVKAMIAEAVQKFGKLDILVNNAGIYPNVPVLEMTKEDFEKILNVNLKGAFFANKAAAKQMVLQGKGGKIINITSIDALHPSGIGLAIYDASKHGLWGFTKNLALELAPHKIWVNAIAPGVVATPGTGFGKSDDSAQEKFFDALKVKVPMHRFAEADDIARTALFLASDLSLYMTGSQIVVDGGLLLA